MTTRRAFSALLAGSMLSFAGSGTAGAEEARRGGELVLGIDGAAVVTIILDPHNSSFAPHNRMFRSIYDNLVQLLPDQSVGPWLATSWDVSADRLAYTFKLRRDVRFHDGTVFDAQAVKANLDRVTEARNGLNSRAYLGPYAGADVLADDTVRVRLSSPFTPLLRNLSMTTLAIVSPAAVAKYGATFSQNPVGTGPFRLASLVQGSEVRLERNAGYNWAPPTAGHAGPAYLERLIFKNVPEEATRVAALQSRQVHAVDAIPPQNIAGIKADPAYRLLEQEFLNNNYALYLNAAKAPWDDVEIRHAVQTSLDLDTVVRVIYFGTEPRAWSLLSPSFFGSHEKELANAWSYDPKRAARILDAKGWVAGADGVREKNGKRLVINFIDTQGNREKRLDVLQLIRRQLARSGIGFTLQELPAGTYNQKLAANEFDLAASSLFAGDPDVLRRQFVPDARPASSGIRVNDAEITAWLNAAATQDDTERSRTYLAAQRKLIQQAYAIPVYVLIYNIATLNDVQGVAFDAHGYPHFQSAWLASRPG